MTEIDQCLATLEDVKGSVDEMLRDNRKLVQVLKDIEISGPDDDGVLWIHINAPGLAQASVAVRGDITAGRVVEHWRDRQVAVLGDDA